MQLILLAIVAAAGPGQRPEAAELKRFEAAEAHMGTSFQVVLYAPGEEAARAALRQAFARVEQLDGVLSDYAADSELNRLVAQAPTAAPVPVSDDLFRVLERSLHYSRRSDGAFDVTVGPLSRLWRRARRRKQMPDADRLATARQAVGYNNLQLDAEQQTVTLLRPKMRLDLGAIAKGYAADEALRVLRERGLTRALVNAGGDIVAGDPPPDRPGWRIGIAPLDPQAPPSRFLEVRRAAVATSGDAWQFVEIDGRRYSHIIDPRTGIGLTDRSSVTVVAGDGATADALASAVCVLGPRDGLRLVDETPAAAAIIVRLENDVVKTYRSRRFEQLRFWQPQQDADAP